MGPEFSEYSESYLRLNGGQLTLQQTPEQTGQNKRSPHSAIVCSGIGGTAFVSQTRTERKTSCSISLTVGWNTIHQMDSGAISPLVLCPTQVEGGGFLKQHLREWDWVKKEGQWQWSLKAWHDGGQVVGLNGGGATTQRTCCPFPLEWRFPRKALLFRPRSVAVEGSGELVGREEVSPAGGCKSRACPTMMNDCFSEICS